MDFSTSGRNINQGIQQFCPFAEKCYRKNPVHFSEMRHPHLEKLVENQLEGSVVVPNILGFECRDRSILLDQLKIVQMVLRKERGIIPSRNGTTPFTQSTNTNSPTGTSVAIPKIQTSAVSQPIPVRSQNTSVLSQHLNSPTLKLRNSPTTSVKRGRSDSPDSIEVKKPRDHVKNQDSPKASQSQKPNTPQNSQKFQKSQIPDSPKTTLNSQSDPSPGASSTKNVSIFDKYSTCSTLSSREACRETAMMQMLRANHKIPHMGSKGEFDMKYALSAPYYVFLTAVQDSPETWSQPYSITFPEILDISLGEIEESLHINFMVDVGWLCLQYLFACQPPKMMILLGERCDTQALPKDIKVVKVELASKYGTHHSKISVLRYKNGVRIIVSTANLYEDDWQNRTQALWISPHLPKLPESADETEGESKTGFKTDFLRYLQNYGANRVQNWLDVLQRTDFSSIDVFFLASVPGNHKEGNRDRYGLRRLRTLLSNHAELPDDRAKWSVVAQSSSIGRLGNNFESWLGKDVLTTLSSETTKGLRSAPKFQFIYPTVENYQQSFDMSVGSCCLPYGGQLHTKQTWLSNYCHQWKSEDKSRTQAMPHVKSYTRISPDFKKIPWIVITSANMSKAAWGWGGQNNNTILSYEAGVVFFPKFLTNSTTFPIKEPDETGTPPFPLPYDVPLTPYRPRDEIFTFDFFNV